MTQMQNPDQSIDDQDLAELETLADEWVENGGMPLKALDGFFSALVVGPGPVRMPSEYLAMAVGEDPPWSSQEEAARALDLLMRLWNHVAWRVRQPIPDEDDESEQARELGLALLPI